MAPPTCARFRDRETARRAVRLLVDQSVPVERIRVTAGEGPDAMEVPTSERNGMWRGAIIGAVVGTVVGGLLVALIALGVLPDPDIGIVPASAAVGILQGAVAGLLLGGLSGLIWGLGVWNVELTFPAGVEGKVIVVRVTPFSGREGAAREVLLRAGGEAVEA